MTDRVDAALDLRHRLTERARERRERELAAEANGGDES